LATKLPLISASLIWMVVVRGVEDEIAADQPKVSERQARFGHELHQWDEDHLVGQIDGDADQDKEDLGKRCSGSAQVVPTQATQQRRETAEVGAKPPVGLLRMR
jgi:hypothetical protein